MAAYMDYLETTIDPKTGLSSDGQLGDWLGPQNNALGSPFLVTAYHAYDLGIMAKVAEILGKSDDAAKYRGMYEKRKAFFNATFVNAERKTLGIGGGRGGRGAPPTPPEFRVADTQTSYAVGLAMGLFNGENTPYMIKNLAETVARENKDDDGVVRPRYSLMTGFIGTSWISKALSDNGLSELAYRILHNNQYPSWLYAIDQGATSIWERLNGYTVENGFGGNNSMNSFNHYSFGAVGQWMMAYSLGIQRDEPGFKKFILQPEPDPTGVMTSAEGYYDSDAANAVLKGSAGQASEDAQGFDLRPDDAAIDSRRRGARGCSRAYAVRTRADEAPTIYHPCQFTLSVEGSYASATRDPHDSVQPKHLRALGANIEPVRRPLTRSDKPCP